MASIWWVRLNDGRYGLRINFNGIVHMDISQIRFNGADANLLEKDGQSVFALSLRENADIEIFNRFGEDLLSVSIYDDKQKYADALFIRMKQWMKFLQKLKKKEIDVRVQIGLMAELKFLEYMHSEYLCTYEELLAAWQGPERASKDFMFDNFFAEIKACFDDERSIRISNEKQLMQESKKLFLICYKSLYNYYNIADLVPAISKIKKNITFINADKKGNNMYSAGINHYISFIQQNPTLLFDIAVSSSLNDTHEIRLARLQKKKGKPQKSISNITIYNRNPDVIAERLYIASGYCEDCKQKAPFLRKSTGEPYLEVHHIFVELVFIFKEFIAFTRCYGFYQYLHFYSLYSIMVFIGIFHLPTR